MQFLDNDAIVKAFAFRHACKEFDGGKSVSEADFRTILETGRLSPSSFGFEPWKFLVLDDKNVRDKLFSVAWGGQDALKNASKFVVILARTNADLHPDSEYLTHIMKDIKGFDDNAQKARREFFREFQKTHFAIYNDEQKVFDWACKQCYIALGNMLTTAALLGVDSLPIEGFNRQSATKILKNEGLIDTKHFGIAVMVAFGYRKKSPKHPQSRQSFDEVVKFV